MIGVLVVVGLGVLLWRRGLTGYPPVPGEFVVLARREVAFLQAAGETLFPPSPDLPLSGGEADISMLTPMARIIPRRNRSR